MKSSLSRKKSSRNSFAVEDDDVNSILGEMSGISAGEFAAALEIAKAAKRSPSKQSLLSSYDQYQDYQEPQRRSLSRQVDRKATSVSQQLSIFTSKILHCILFYTGLNGCVGYECGRDSQQVF
jgi:oligoendopeptidase F